MPKAKTKKRKVIKPKTLLELLLQKVNVNSLLESVYIDEDNLVGAALEQPTLIVQAGRFRVQRMHVRVKLETKLDLQRARVGLRFRRIRDPGGRKEFTEGAVKERIELDPSVKRIRRKLDAAVALEELAKNLIEVFRTRSDSLRVIVQAGKVSLHARELEIMRGNKKLRTVVNGIRRSWESGEE